MQSGQRSCCIHERCHSMVFPLFGGKPGGDLESPEAPSHFALTCQALPPRSPERGRRLLHRKPETFRNYRQYLHGHLVPRFGAKRLARLARADVRTLQRDLEGERLNGTAAAHLHAQPDQIAVAGVMRDLYPEEEVPVHCEDLGRITLKGFVSAVRLYSVS